MKFYKILCATALCTVVMMYGMEKQSLSELLQEAETLKNQMEMKQMEEHVDPLWHLISPAGSNIEGKELHTSLRQLISLMEKIKDFHSMEQSQRINVIKKFIQDKSLARRV